MGLKLRFPNWRDMDKKDTPLTQLFEDFLLAKRSAGCSENTVIWYRANLRAYLRFLQADSSLPVLGDFGASGVRRYIVHLQDRRNKYEGNRFRRTAQEPLSTQTR